MTRDADGFALVEVVVALAIVAAILGATFQTLSAARRTIDGAEQRRAAMLEARSLVAGLGSTIPLVPGEAQGQDGAMRWRVEIETVNGRELLLPLRHATVTVSDEQDRPLARLETMRLAR